MFRRLFHRDRQQGSKVNVATESPTPLEIVPPTPFVPQPEIIDEKSHPLRFYPGFDEFAALWNEHASTDTRLGLKLEIQLAQSDIDNLSNKSTYIGLKEELERRLEEQRKRQEIYNAQKDVPRREKIAPLKSANRRAGKAKQALDISLQQEQRLRKEKDDHLKVAKASLVDMDNEFGLELHEDIVKFYVVERLRKGPEDAIDSFLISFSERKELSERKQRPFLWGINLSFFYLLEQYEDTAKGLVGDEFKANADIATNRQLGRARRQSGLTTLQ